jgi:hypothetical protein
MGAHTPGPWDIFTIASPAGVSSRIFKEGDDTTPAIDIAHIPMAWNGDGSNARLIAAAPELLLALKLMESLFDTEPEPDGRLDCRYVAGAPKLVSAVQAARAAILTATGAK